MLIRIERWLLSSGGPITCTPICTPIITTVQSPSSLQLCTFTTTITVQQQSSPHADICTISNSTKVHSFCTQTSYTWNSSEYHHLVQSMYHHHVPAVAASAFISQNNLVSPPSLPAAAAAAASHHHHHHQQSSLMYHHACILLNDCNG